MKIIVEFMGYQACMIETSNPFSSNIDPLTRGYRIHESWNQLPYHCRITWLFNCHMGHNL